MGTEKMSNMEDQDPRTTLLRSNFALLIGREDWAVYGIIKTQDPHVLKEP